MSQSTNTADSASGRAGVTCKKCGNRESWGGSSFCPRCGFYPTLNRCVASAASANNVDPLAEEETIIDIPQWVQTLVLVSLGILAVDVALRFILLDEVAPYFSIPQFVVGFLMAGFAHWTALLYASRTDAKLGPFDLVSKPFAIWEATIETLPASRRRVWIGAWGLTNILGAILLGGIGSFIFDDWGIEHKKSDTNLLKKVVQTAHHMNASDAVNASTATSLDEAISDFAGVAENQAGVMDAAEGAIDAAGSGGDGSGDGSGDGVGDGTGTDLESGSGEPLDPEEKEQRAAEKKEKELRQDPTRVIDLPTLDCLIVGYTETPQEDVALLIVASVMNRRLMIVGQVPGASVPDGIRARILQRMKPLRREQPVVLTEQEAIWLNPKLMCKVAFHGRKPTGELVLPVFRQLLPDVGTKKPQAGSKQPAVSPVR